VQGVAGMDVVYGHPCFAVHKIQNACSVYDGPPCRWTLATAINSKSSTKHFQQ